METTDAKTVVVDLDNSLFAHVFSENNLIHQEEMNRAMDIIDKQIGQISEKKEACDVYLEHNYRTIGVFGDRGSGKTSFLISVLQLCKKQHKDVEVLQMIDPTLVEHKKPIVLCIISMINKLVEEKLRRDECSVDSDSYIKRREWDRVKKSVACGIISIENVGQDFNNSLWQDEDYVIHTGLKKVADANDFEANLRRMIETALNILNKRAFILSFDDIDVDVKQGWHVLETLRRYLSDSHIISIVSGNIKLYGPLVRQELCAKLPIQEREQKKLMSNELESQYMLKLLKPANRINLHSLKSILQLGNFVIEIEHKNNKDDRKNLNDTYEKILSTLGVEDKFSQQVYIDFLLSMSLRSQIHFMKEALLGGNNVLPLEVFKSRMMASRIDVDNIINNPQMTNVIILEYLNRIQGLSHRYLLLPTTSDKDINSNLTALTFTENKLFDNNQFLIFDYMLRIGYMRNVTLSLSGETISNLFNYAGWLQDMSLKNNVGLTIAYLMSTRMSDMKELIPLYAMQEVAKKNVDNALDNLLKKEINHIAKVVVMLPYIGVVHRSNNESRSFYSVMSLLAVVVELLKCDSEDIMASCIDNLKFFRSYQIPNDNNNFNISKDVMSASYGVEVESESINKLANWMWKWKSQYEGSFVPPYVLGRIMTRFYSSLLNVEGDTVGDRMCNMVANFFNACIVEESRAILPYENHRVINNNNLRKDTKILKDNLGKADVITRLKFSKWIMVCPILYLFLDKETLSNIQNGINGIKDNHEKPFEISVDESKIDVYSILKQINCKPDGAKNDERPVFSGSKKNWEKTKDYLIAGGISEDDIRRDIVNKDIDNAVIYIKNTNLFSRVSKNSVRQFIEQWGSSENHS